MTLRDQLVEKNKVGYEDDGPKLPVALWNPPGITFDVTVLWTKMVPKKAYDDKSKVTGEQLLVRGILNAPVQMLSQKRAEWVTVNAGEQIQIYVDPGKKFDTLIAALDAAGVEELLPLDRFIMKQEGTEPATKEGNSPTKLYQAALYPNSDQGENGNVARSAPYFAHCPGLIQQILTEEAEREARIAEAVAKKAQQGPPAAATPVPMAAQLSPLAAAPPAAPLAPAAAPVAPAPGAAPAQVAAAPAPVAPAAAPAVAPAPAPAPVAAAPAAPAPVAAPAGPTSLEALIAG